MRKIFLTAVAVITMAYSYDLIGQDLNPEEKLINYKLETILSNLNSYRFGEINIWKVEDISKPEEILRPYLSISQQVDIDSGVINNIISQYGQEVYDYMCQECASGTNPNDIIQRVLERYNEIPTIQEASQVCAQCAGNQAIGSTFQSIYLITTRTDNIEDRGDIIAAMASKTNLDVQEDLLGVDSKFILTFVELRNIPDPDNQSRSLLDIFEDYLDQGYVIHKTSEAQGQGNRNWFVRKNYGVTESLIKEEDIESKDIQSFIRISEGLPHDIKEGKLNELMVSPDLISWRKYPWDEYNDDPEETITNERLPIYGAELRYGIEAINLPSFYSERWTLSAIWESVKLGLVLPTPGWTNTFTDLYSIDRKFTTAGPGIAANFDFPFPVIPQSGIFNFDFSYVSGDAVESSFKPELPPGLNVVDSTFDYLVRAHAQLHYTFGVSIDNNYLLRFGLGGTIYNVESWHYKREEITLPNGGLEIEDNFVKSSSETLGGLSGRIEFMTKNNSTPWGASINYFEETLLAQIWLQIPVINNTFAVRLDAKGYFILRNDQDLNAWEVDNQAIVIPMMRLIYFF